MEIIQLKAQNIHVVLLFHLNLYFKTLSVYSIDECSEDNIDRDGDDDKSSQHQEEGPGEELQAGVVKFLKAGLHQATAGGWEKSQDWEDSANLLSRGRYHILTQISNAGEEINKKVEVEYRPMPGLLWRDWSLI